MENKTKIELHCHTTMSAEKGLIRPADLVRYAYESGYKAVAITDCGNVQAFPEAYRTWKKLWDEYRKKNSIEDDEPVGDEFLKVIYGMEGYLTDEVSALEEGYPEDREYYPILIYAKDEKGIRNLYKIVTASHLQYYDELLLIPRTVLDEYREGLLVGSVCDGGEVYTAVHSGSCTRTDEEYRRDIKRKISYYDFVEVSPFSSGPDERYMYHCYKNGALLVAASDAYYMDEEDKTVWEILTSKNDKQYSDRPRHIMKYEKNPFRCWHAGMPEVLKIIPDAVFYNQSIITDQIGYLSPLRKGRYLPKYPDADEKLAKICREKATELYGKQLPEEVKDRLGRELQGICKKGYAGIFMIWHLLARESEDKGYLVVARGAAASSFVAFLCGITEINPLSQKAGGNNVPFETFFGLDFEKEPDIEMNFAGEIQEYIQNHVSKLPGIGETCYAGTIGTLQEERAKRLIEVYCDKNEMPLPGESDVNHYVKMLAEVKTRDGQHPGGIVVCPDEEIVSFTPLQHPENSNRVITQFEYHSIDHNLLKLIILSVRSLDLLHELQEMTGIPAKEIPMDDDKVLSLLCDPELKELPGIIEFGSEAIRRMIGELRPKSFSDLIKISALAHGTEVWWGNQRELVTQNRIGLQDCISARDDIYLLLLDKGMDRIDAYMIMDSVRRGKGLNDRQRKQMVEVGVPEWYISVCEKIKYLFPKAHCASYTLLAWRLAYYKVYYPDLFEEAMAACS